MSDIAINKASVRSKGKTRLSGLELLRIIAMIFIVASHLSQFGRWSWLAENRAFSANEALMNLIICFGQVGVAIFFSITGYFLYSQKQYKIKRILSVLRPTYFYAYSFLIIGLIMKSPLVAFSWPLNKAMGNSLFPITTNAYWFISSYVVLHFLLPYIKTWLDNLDKKGIVCLLLIIAGASVIPNLISYSFVGVSSLIFPVSCAIFYSVVGYAIHKYSNLIARVKSSKFLILSGFGVLTYFVCSLIIRFCITHLNYQVLNNNILIDTMSLPCMMTAIPLVIIFSRLKFINATVNYVAGLVFGVYLIHTNILFEDYVWGNRDLLGTYNASGYSFPVFMGYFFGSVILVFALCAVIEACRKGIVVLCLWGKMQNTKKA